MKAYKPKSEYLAIFKKTVQIHEVFLTRLATHPAFRHDTNLRIFLEYSKDLNVRAKNTKEKFGGLVKSLSKNADELRLINHKENDEFFEGQKKFLTDYYNKIRESCFKADRFTFVHRSMRLFPLLSEDFHFHFHSHFLILDWINILAD
jgi:sorting nexin-5/6/32